MWVYSTWGTQWKCILCTYVSGIYIKEKARSGPGLAFSSQDCSRLPCCDPVSQIPAPMSWELKEEEFHFLFHSGQCIVFLHPMAPWPRWVPLQQGQSPVIAQFQEFPIEPSEHKLEKKHKLGNALLSSGCTSGFSIHRLILKGGLKVSVSIRIFIACSYAIVKHHLQVFARAF